MLVSTLFNVNITSTTWMERNQVHFGRITKLYYNNHSPEKHPEIYDFIYVVVSTPFETYDRQNGNLLQVGVKKNIWNHHLRVVMTSSTHLHQPPAAEYLASSILRSQTGQISASWRWYASSCCLRFGHEKAAPPRFETTRSFHPQNPRVFQPKRTAYVNFGIEFGHWQFRVGRSVFFLFVAKKRPICKGEGYQFQRNGIIVKNDFCEPQFLLKEFDGDTPKMWLHLDGCMRFCLERRAFLVGILLKHVTQLKDDDHWSMQEFVNISSFCFSMVAFHTDPLG